MKDIPGSENFHVIRPIKKGWSDSKKYYIETITGEKLFLRISGISGYERIKKEFEVMQKIAMLDVPIPIPIGSGICNDGNSVYSLFSWIEGEEGVQALSKMTSEEQYIIGIKAGSLLAKIHTIPAPKGQEEWKKRFDRKTSVKIEKYRACGIKIADGEKIINYIEENRDLLADRPQSFQHGDYHIGNMIISQNGELTILDFDRFDHGDPWEEFNRIVWCAAASRYFASGRINGYFNGNPPIEFFKLLAFYISSNTLSSIYWAIPFGQKEIETMTNQAKDVVNWFSDMTDPVPKWYIETNY